MKIKFFNLIAFLPFLFSSINSFTQEDGKLNISWVKDYTDQSDVNFSLDKIYINNRQTYNAKHVFPNQIGFEKILNDSIILNKVIQININGKIENLSINNGENLNKHHFCKLLFINDKLYCLIKYYDEKFVNYYIQEYNETFEPRGKMLEILKVPVFSEKSVGNIKLLTSQNQKYFALFWSNVDHKQPIYNYAVFNENFQKIYSKDKFSLPYESLKSEIDKNLIFLSNDAHLIYLEEEYKSTNNKDQENLVSLHIHHVFESSDKDYKVSIENKQVNKLRLINPSDNTYTIIGIYKNKNSSENNYGVFDINFNFDNDEIEETNYIPLDDSYLMQGFSENEIQQVLRAKNNGTRISTKSIYFFNILDIKNVTYYEDGSRLLELELNSGSGGDSWNTNGGISSEFGNITGSPMGSGGPNVGGSIGAAGAPSGSTPQYHSEDIYILKINPNGKIDWKTKIRKRQLYYPNIEYMSYCSYQHNNQLHILYNDNLSNKDVKCQDVPSEYKRKEQIITHVIVDLLSGSTNKYVCDEEKLKEMFILPGFKTEQTDDKFYIKIADHSFKSNKNRKSAAIELE
jgi:hypothetical protein